MMAEVVVPHSQSGNWLCVSDDCNGGGWMEGICHVGFWSFKRAFLISFWLTWVMFIVTVEMSSQLPHSSQQFN